MLQRAYNVRLYPNKQQEVLLCKTFGCCRKVYNCMLEARKKSYETTGKQCRSKPTDFYAEFPFLKEVDSNALTAEVLTLNTAFKNWHVIQTNSVGVIDNSYCGPNDWWKMPVYAMEDTKIEKGQKIAQFRIMEIQPEVVLEEGKMEGEDRGGFGSTGKV